MQRGCADQAYRNLFIGFVFGGRKFDGNIGLLESGNLVVVGQLGIGFVSGAVDQMEMQAILTLGYEDAFMRQRDAWIRGIGNIGEKDAFPDSGTLSSVHVLHVQHELWKAFVEDSRLHFEGNLRAFELILKMPERCQRPRRQIKAIDQSASAHAPTTKIASTRPKLHTPMPLARMAVISLSAASRLSPIRIPTSTLIGMV